MGARASCALPLIAAAWLLQPAAAQAQCQPLFEFIQGDDLPQADTVDAITFQKGGRGDLILLTFKKGGEKDALYWKFLERRQKDTLIFCQVGHGREFGKLADVHTNSSDQKFGMPGSGNPRCSSHNSVLPGSIAVRWWANRELGESVILYGDSKETSGFQFLISLDDAWIIIEDKKNKESSSCYFDRGEKILFKAGVSRKKESREMPK